MEPKFNVKKPGCVFIVFVTSLAYPLFLLLVEETVGIGRFYHRDSYTYFENAITEFSYEIFLSNFGNLYYLTVGMLGRDVSLLISLNMLCYAMTNCLLWTGLKKGVLKTAGYFQITLIVILIYEPYRAHFAIVPLKETFVFFGLALMLPYRGVIFSILGALISIGSTNRSLYYIFMRVYSSFFSRFPFFITTLSIIVGLLFYVYNSSFNLVNLDFLYSEPQSMTVRQYDNIPTYSDVPDGRVIRSIIWPLITIFGLAPVVSGSEGFLIFAPLSIFPPVLASFILLYRRSFWPILFLFLGLAVIAFLVPGYTAYIRYCWPLLFVFLLESNREH